MTATAHAYNRGQGVKVVLYGPGRGGKTTNLDRVSSVAHAEIVHIPVDSSDCNVLFVDLPRQDSFKGGMSLYTVPGTVPSRGIWVDVLKDVLGVVFVADSENERFAENTQAMHDLVEDLAQYRLKLEDFPCVLQYNKRDLKGARALEKMDRELNPLGLPAFEAKAVEGTGVLACLQAINYLIGKGK